MIGIGIALVAFGLFLAGVWILAQMGIIWVFVPANTIALVVARGNETPNEAGISGTDVVNIIHAVPGMKLDKSDDNLIEWTLVKGKEKGGLLHFILKAHYIGPSNTLRVNTIHELRFGKDKRENSTSLFKVQSSDPKTKYVYFSRELAVPVENADTMGAFEADMDLNLLYKMLQPAKAILDVANANAVLTIMVNEAVNNTTGTKEAQYFVQGPASHKQEIVDAVNAINTRAVLVLGIDIYSVNLYGIDFDAETRKLLQSKDRTRVANENLSAEIETANKNRLATAESNVKIAEKELEKKKMENAGEADHVNTVLLPLANSPGGPAIRWAEAYEKNKTVTTFGGTGNLGIIVDPGNRSSKKVGFETPTSK